VQPTNEQRKEWEARFERIGEIMVRSDLQFRNGVGIGISGEAMHHVVSDWLRNKEQQREVRERRLYIYTKWTLIAAAAAVVVGVIGIIVTLYH